MMHQTRGVRGLGRRIALTLVLIGAALTLGVSASAGPGVRFSRADIRVDQPLFVGNTYSLPVVTISNPGDVVAEYEIAIADRDSGALPIPREWLLVEPANFQLRPGQTRKVESILVIPYDAQLGRYEGLLAARIAPPDASDTPGASVGAGAAAPLTFEVRARTLLETLARTISALWHGGGSWSYGLTGLVVVSLALVWVFRRFRLKIEPRIDRSER